MGKKLYVGNLSFDVDDKTMEELFAAYGTVESADVINDRRTGQSKGFGFVEMSSNEEAKAAISGLGKRTFTVWRRSVTILSINVSHRASLLREITVDCLQTGVLAAPKSHELSMPGGKQVSSFCSAHIVL